jgi:cation transport regulator ChaC
MPLYFAYGSNMDRAAMAARCPQSKALGPARLMRHRFLVTGDGYASVTRDPRRVVWGLLWDLALSDVRALDRYESLHTGLYAKVVQPVLTEQGPRRAMLYVGRSNQPGAPKAGYLEGVVAAAETAGLPEAYLRELQASLPGRPTPAEAAPAAPKVRPRFAAPPNVRRHQ